MDESYVSAPIDDLPTAATITNDTIKYGELILLGYNGSQDNTHSNGRRHLSKMIVCQRSVGNGIKKSTVSKVNVPPRQTQAVQDRTRHVVSFTYGRNHSVIVEYKPDDSKDMFQIGRSSEDQIDFTVVDTCLAYTSSNGNSQSGGHQHRPASSTISRYACRILIDREYPHVALLYAAGFNELRNISLGEKATKWTKKNGEVDGLTTNGVLILHPRSAADNQDNSSQLHELMSTVGIDRSSSSMYVWREVSVDGDIYTLRESRSSPKRGDLVRDETNQLQDGTLIDLCGATLLWRTAEGLSQSPSRSELELRLDELNAGKPQCPVNLNTLIIPRRKSPKTNGSERQPYVYLSCGHVQGKHKWGLTDQNGITPKYKCPICMVESVKILQLIMGMESAFHLDSEALDYAFNPCGHVASLRTVRYWSRIPLPHGTNSFQPVCPFCTWLLDTDKSYVRLIFQDHCYEN